MKAPRYIYECQKCKDKGPEATGLNVTRFCGWCNACRQSTLWVNVGELKFSVDKTKSK